MTTPVNQLFKWLADNTNLTLATDITTHFYEIERKYYNDMLNGLFDEVKHGDQEHQDWLKAHFDEYIKIKRT